MGSAAPVNIHITGNQLEALNAWFTAYVHSFYSANRQIQQPLKLKEDHSLRVRAAVLHIGCEMALAEGDLGLAEAMGLFHDIGRFEQLIRYGTFVDRKSENHALLGIDILKREGVLSFLNPETQDLILKAIRNHNLLSVPDSADRAEAFFSRLLRDADKLDILEIFSHYYYAKPEERNGAVELDLPDLPDVSEEVLKRLLAGKMVAMHDLRTLNDFKLLQMAWVYDVNFRPTFRMIFENEYLQKIRGTLPSSAEIDRIYDRLIDHTRGQMKK